MTNKQYDTRKTLIQKIYPDASLPVYGSAQAVGADVYAYLKEDPQFMQGVTIATDPATGAVKLTFRPGGRCLISTGLRIKPADGFEIQVRSRSSLPLKTGLIVGNSPGTMDPDYTGALGITLINTSDTAVDIVHNDRIAQLVLAPVVRLTADNTTIVTESMPPLPEIVVTVRGDGGFGSTDNLTRGGDLSDGQIAGYVHEKGLCI